jgi:hypothetical protein
MPRDIAPVGNCRNEGGLLQESRQGYWNDGAANANKYGLEKDFCRAAHPFASKVRLDVSNRVILPQGEVSHHRLRILTAKIMDVARTRLAR